MAIARTVKPIAQSTRQEFSGKAATSTTQTLPLPANAALLQVIGADSQSVDVTAAQFVDRLVQVTIPFPRIPSLTIPADRQLYGILTVSASSEQPLPVFAFNAVPIAVSGTSRPAGPLWGAGAYSSFNAQIQIAAVMNDVTVPDTTTFTATLALLYGGIYYGQPGSSIPGPNVIPVTHPLVS